MTEPIDGPGARRAVLWLDYPDLVDLLRRLATDPIIPPGAALVGIEPGPVRQRAGFVFAHPSLLLHAPGAESYPLAVVPDDPAAETEAITENRRLRAVGRLFRQIDQERDRQEGPDSDWLPLALVLFADGSGRVTSRDRYDPAAERRIAEWDNLAAAEEALASVYNALLARRDRT